MDEKPIANIDDLVSDSGHDMEIYAPDEGFRDNEDALRDTSLHVVRCLFATPRGEED